MAVGRISPVAMAALAALLLGACGSSGAGEVHAEPAITIEEIEGSDLERLTLSPRAMVRLGIEVVPLSEATADGERRGVVPYSAVLYGADGQAWVYTSPEDGVFVRQPIAVVTVEDGQAILSDGPPSGTLVVTVGVAELHGAEAGVGGGH